MLQEADYGLTEAAMSGSNARYLGDQFLLVRFFMHPRHSPSRSLEEGRPIYEELPYIEIMSPGNKDNIACRPATQMDKARFPEHWRKFQAREDQNTVEGSLLEEWPLITRSQVEELKFFNVRTVEQLANLSDAHAQNIMGINMLKDKAKKYLEAAKEKATTAALAEAREQIEALKAQMEQVLSAKAEQVDEADFEEESEDDED